MSVPLRSEGTGDPGPIIGLSHIQLLVSDVQTSADWYRAALGLDPFADDPQIGYVALRHRQANFVVVLTKRPYGHGSDSDDGALDHLALAVSDADMLRAWARHLSNVGIVHDGVELENGRPSLHLRDPDGICIELVAPRQNSSS